MILVIYSKKWEENTQSNENVNMILKNQRMKIFLTQNISAFTLRREVVNKRLIFMTKKNLLFFACLFFFQFLICFFYLVVSYLFCFNFCFCTECQLTSGLLVPVFGTGNKAFGDAPYIPCVFMHQSETVLISSYHSEIILKIKTKRKWEYVFRYKILSKCLVLFGSVKYILGEIYY